MQIPPRFKQPLKFVLLTLVPAAFIAVVFQNCSDSGLPDNLNEQSSTAGSVPNNGIQSSDGDGIGTVPPPPGAKYCRFFMTGGNYWKVPTDFNSNVNTVEVIGSGADGGGNTRGGGGGGAYAKSVNVALPAGQTVMYNVAHLSGSYPLSGHGTATSGGDAYLCNSTANCGSLQGSAVVAGAEGGWTTTNSAPRTSQDSGIDEVGGMGGRAAASVARGTGSVAYSGGRGGDCYIDCSYSPSSAPGSGGGAAGPHGNGIDGGSGVGHGGAGDGGYGGAGGGASSAGANGTEWDASHGSGGGGGGSVVNVGGARGGNFGGGGGGGGNDAYGTITAADASGIGGGGLIVVTYLGVNCQ